MEQVEQFLTKLTDVQDELEGFERDVDDRRRGLLEVIGRVDDAVRGVQRQADTDRYGEAVDRRIDEVISRVRESTREWRAGVQEQIDQTEFISRFDRSVVVMVYGKVNCGKSTLGNFIAGLPFRELDDSPYDGFSPRFRIHEVSEASDCDGMKTRPLESGFPTDTTESTAEIQEFTLGGLTWVDSPGIHAMTRSNEALAKKYVDAAELVVFLTSSDSPGRRSVMKELERLMGAQKPTLLTVSKFDVVEKDIHPDKFDTVKTLKPKSDQSRREQRGTLEERVEEFELEELLQDRRYVFVSSKVAKKALRDGDEELFRASGMAEFYDQLGGVLSRDAVELKKKNPKRAFNGLVQKIWGGRATDDGRRTLANLKANMQSKVDFVAEKRSELRELGAAVVSRTCAAVAPPLEARLVEAADRVEAGIGDSALKRDVANIIDESLQKELSKTVARAMRDVMEQVDQVQLDTGDWDIPPVEVLTEEIEVTRSPLGGGIGSATGGTAGAMVGLYFGGPIGAAIGGIAGSVVGATAGSKIAGTKTVEAPVGTNADEVVSKVLGEMERQLPELVNENLEHIDEMYFEPLQSAFELGVDRLDEIETELLDLRYE